MQPVSAMRGGAEMELNACVGDGLDLGGSTGAGGKTSRSESMAKRLTEAKREGVIGGGLKTARSRTRRVLPSDWCLRDAISFLALVRVSS